MQPYILFKPHLEVQIILLKHRGQRGCGAARMRGRGRSFGGGIRRNPSLLSDAGDLPASLPNRSSCRRAAQLPLESLGASTPSRTPLSRFSSWDDSGEAMSCFIHSDASHTILNPSRRRGSGSANFNKFVQLQSQRQRMPGVEVLSILLAAGFCANIN